MQDPEHHDAATASTLPAPPDDAAFASSAYEMPAQDATVDLYNLLHLPAPVTGRRAVAARAKERERFTPVVPKATQDAWETSRVAEEAIGVDIVTAWLESHVAGIGRVHSSASQFAVARFGGLDATTGPVWSAGVLVRGTT